MKKRKGLILTGGLAPQLLKDKGFQKLAEEGTVLSQGARTESEESASQAGVPNVELWGFNQAAQPIVVPRWEPVNRTALPPKAFQRGADRAKDFASSN